MNRNTIIQYEELSMNAHPALKTQLLDGWILRFSNGYTSRANSVSPLYEAHMPYAKKVGFCEKLYSKQELPTLFKLTDASAEGLDAYLAGRGYEVAAPTFLYINKGIPNSEIRTNVQIRSHISNEWCSDYFRLNAIADLSKAITAQAMLKLISNEVLCAQIEQNGKVIACGLCVIERGFAGLYDIVVDQAYRGKGYGYELCGALLNKAGELGGREAYLQVVASNIPAIALYKKLGFAYCYQYWYRVRKTKKGKTQAAFSGKGVRVQT